MTQHQFDIQLGQDRTQIVRTGGTSIGTSMVRITIDDANCPSKADAVKLLQVMLQRLRTGNWPPP